MAINQLQGWQLRGVKCWVETEKTKGGKTNEEGKGVSERGRFKIHPGAVWENYEPPFSGCQGCV